MKHALLVTLAFVLAIVSIVLCSAEVFADDVILEDTTTAATDPDPAPAPSGSNENVSPEITIIMPEQEGFDPNNIIDVSIVTSTNPVTPQNANGLKKVILTLIGNYDMVTSEYTYTSNNGYQTKQVTTEPDYAWMISAAIFLIVIFCIFRLFGGVLRGRR